MIATLSLCRAFAATDVVCRARAQHTLLMFICCAMMRRARVARADDDHAARRRWLPPLDAAYRCRYRSCFAIMMPQIMLDIFAPVAA